MTFAATPWLYVGAALLGLIALMIHWAERRRKKSLARLAAPRLVPGLTASSSKARRILSLGLSALALFLLTAALARPQLGATWEEVERKGIDLMFAVDVSKSMLAEDIRPNRLQRAKLAVEDLVQKFEGDRVGLIAFAGDAFLQCPLTLDRGIFRRSLRTLDPEVIPLGGTHVARAIETARSAAASEPDHEKLLVLLTDGEDLGGRAIAAARQAAEDGLRIYTVGVGREEGELVPIEGDGADAGRTFLRDRQGELVKTKLDRGTLEKVAAITGGAYAPLGADGGGLLRLYERHLAHLPKRAVSARQRRVPIERFAWPLGGALALLLLGPLVGRRRWRVAVLGGLLFLLPAGADAAGVRAQEYNAAVSAYQKGDFEEAERSFGEVLGGEDMKLEAMAYYNRGNARYRLGEALLEEAPEEAKARWTSAAEDFESALRLRPDDENAAFNLAFVRRKLEALEEKEEEQRRGGSCDKPEEQGGQNRADGEPQAEQGGGDDQGSKKAGEGQDGDQDEEGEGDRTSGGSRSGDRTDGDEGDGGEGPGPGREEKGGANERAAQREGDSGEGADSKRSDPSAREGRPPRRDRRASPDRTAPAKAGRETGPAAAGAEVPKNERSHPVPGAAKETEALTPEEARRLLGVVSGGEQDSETLILVPAGQAADSEEAVGGKDW